VEVFHYCNSGAATWFTFAQAIFEFSGISCKLKPVSTPDFPAAARRPQYSVLDTAKIRERFGLVIPSWRGSLQKCVQLLLK
jgi:dTDP-4-dehydrorhamnose reductase